MQTENWKKVKEILPEVLPLKMSERQKFLDDSGINAEVRQEIESLLAFDEESEDLMKLSAVEFSKDFFDTKDAAENVLIGQKFGVYKIVSELGYGGMGAVYLAERADGKFEQRVALKLLKREMNTAELRRRFQQEREILASLEHPNIARLLDAGTTDDKIPYLTMEYVEGLPIDDFCNKNQLGLNQRLDLFRKVCAAVDFAHRNLIVHRDLKPSNILVTSDGVPKLLDFGISKILSNEFENVNSATITKLGVMTPSYASPEQLRSESVTTATDIYSLGVILYELLSGHRPFEMQEGDLREIYKAVIELDPPPPSALVKTSPKSLKKITDAKTEVQSENISNLSTIVQNFDNQTESNKFQNTLPSKVNLSSNSLRGDLDNIVLKALRKETERRYSSAENFSEDIRRHQEGLPVTARPNTLLYRTEKFFKRNKAGVFAGILILLAVIGGVIATLWQAQVAQAERAKAENRFNDVRSLANSFLFEITPEIENLSGSTRAKELLVKRALEYLDRLSVEVSDDKELQRELAAAYEKVGDVQGNPYEANIGDMQGALSSYEKARAIREKLLENDQNNFELKAELAKNTQLIGDVLYFTGEIEKATEKYHAAVNSQQEIVAQNPSNSTARYDLASARYALGSTYFWNSDYDTALKHYISAKETLEELSRAEPEDEKIKDKLANSFIVIGEALGWQNKLDESEKNILRGLAMIKPLAEKNPNNSRFRKTLWLAHLKAGELYLDREQFDKSLEHYGNALELVKITVGDDPKNAVAKRNLALNYNKIGDTLDTSGNGAAALENSRKALELQKEIAAADPKNFDIRQQIAGTFKRIGYAQTTMRDYEGSRQSFQNALKQYEQLSVLDPNDKKIPREIAIVSQTIGETYIAAADVGNKTENLQKAIEWIEKSYKLFLQMKAEGTLPKVDYKIFDQLEAQTKDIKNKLGKNS